MKWGIGVALLGMGLLLKADPPSEPKRPNSSKSQTSSVGKKSGSSSSSARRRNTKRARGPSYQAHPDAERYQQIQQALAERGYFKGEANGQWGEDSVDALKRFQADQKLLDDGKINSLTLIGLGLGPKHEGSGASTPVASAPKPAGAAESDGPPQ